MNRNDDCVPRNLRAVNRELVKHQERACIFLPLFNRLVPNSSSGATVICYMYQPKNTVYARNLFTYSALYRYQYFVEISNSMTTACSMLQVRVYG